MQLPPTTIGCTGLVDTTSVYTRSLNSNTPAGSHQQPRNCKRYQLGWAATAHGASNRALPLPGPPTPSCIAPHIAAARPAETRWGGGAADAGEVARPWCVSPPPCARTHKGLMPSPMLVGAVGLRL